MSRGMKRELQCRSHLMLAGHIKPGHARLPGARDK